MNYNSYKTKYPLGKYVHIELPNDYDPVKVDELTDFDIACHVSMASLSHRTWYVPIGKYKEFMDVIDSGKASRWENIKEELE